jgi:hypothetical protein
LAIFAMPVLNGEPSFFRVVLCCGAGEGVQQLNPPVRHRHNADPHLLHTLKEICLKTLLQHEGEQTDQIKRGIVSECAKPDHPWARIIK